MSELARLSLTELNSLLKRVEREIARKSAKARTQVLKELTKLAAAAGLSLADVLPQPKAVRKPKDATEKSRAKRRRTWYANPADPKQRWGGMGKRPTWLKEALASGKALEELRASRVGKTPVVATTSA